MKILAENQLLQIHQQYFLSFLHLTDKYFKNPYIYFVEENDDVLAYNSLNNGYYCLTKQEYYQYLNVIPTEDLINNLFLLDCGIENNLIQVIDKLINNIEQVARENPPALKLIILTTTGCNAQCSYCYEGKLTSKQTSYLKEDIADKIIDFIEKHSYTFGKNKPLTIRWFGGEPLLNYKIINYICEKLYQKNIYYQSSIITNGLLFTEEVYQDSLKYHWNLYKVQIPIDGTEEEYNKIKNFKTNKEQSFQILIKNLENLASKRELSINIRMNLSLYNKKDLLELIPYLNEKFKDYHNLKIYCAQLYDTLGENSCLTPSLRKRFLEDYKEVHNALHKNITKASLAPFSYFNCQAAQGGNNLIILPNGSISPCEHYNKIIPNTNIDNINLESFNRYSTTIMGTKQKTVNPDCIKCWQYPACNRIINCSAKDGMCNKFIVEKDEYSIEETLKGLKNKLTL